MLPPASTRVVNMYPFESEMPNRSLVLQPWVGVFLERKPFNFRRERQCCWARRLLILRFLGCIFAICFDGDINLCALVKAHFVSISILQGILDANFPIEIVSAFDIDLCFFRQAWVRRLNDLLDSSGQGGARLFIGSIWFFAHPEVVQKGHLPNHVTTAG